LLVLVAAGLLQSSVETKDYASFVHQIREKLEELDPDMGARHLKAAKGTAAIEAQILSDVDIYIKQLKGEMQARSKEADDVMTEHAFYTPHTTHHALIHYSLVYYR
jgi:hypothetical protein